MSALACELEKCRPGCRLCEWNGALNYAVMCIGKMVELEDLLLIAEDPRLTELANQIHDMIDSLGEKPIAA